MDRSTTESLGTDLIAGRAKVVSAVSDKPNELCTVINWSGSFVVPPRLPGAAGLAEKVQEIQDGARKTNPVDRFKSCPNNEACTPHACEAGDGKWPRCPTGAEAPQGPQAGAIKRGEPSLRPVRHDLEDCRRWMDSELLRASMDPPVRESLVRAGWTPPKPSGVPCKRVFIDQGDAVALISRRAEATEAKAANLEKQLDNLQGWMQTAHTSLKHISEGLLLQSKGIDFGERTTTNETSKT